MTDRDAFIKIIHTALSAGRADYARYTANDWLTVWPGDAIILTYLARAEMELGFIDSAMERVDQAIQIDPEQIDAYQIKASALRAKGQVQEAQIYQACAQILKKDPLDQGNSPAWAVHLEEAMAHVRRGEFESAVAKASISLTADPQLVLPTYSLMSIQRAAGQDDAAQAVAQNGHQRWSNCVAFLLLLGQAEIERGDHQAGIDLLHRAAMNDPNGHVTKRFLGDKHAYIDLWPVNLEAEMSRPIPAEVANDLGDNQLSVPVQEKQPAPNLKQNL